MAARDGDGWIECHCASKHWGKHGAAGLLMIHNRKIFLQHRAPWVHNGDTWGIPGGARDSHESAQEAAFREAVEETGLDTSGLQVIGDFVDDHTIWSYTTIFAVAPSELATPALNDESHDVRWVDLDDVTRLPLHPSFERSWLEIRRALEVAIENSI